MLWYRAQIHLLPISLLIFLTAFSVFCKGPSPKEIQQKILKDFLDFPGGDIDKKTIEYILYDVQSPTDTMGRSFKISDGLFLTNHHVIRKVIDGKYAQLVKQEKRGILSDIEGEFEVLEYDIPSDLALLRLKKYNPKDDETIVHLYKRTPKVKEKVSEFIHLSGEGGKHKGYHFDFGGKDIYDKQKYIKHLGSFDLPPDSALFEKKGYVLPFKEKEVQRLTKGLPSKKEYEIVTSVPVYQGESGSPIFLEIGEGEYYLAGVTTKTLNTGEMVYTPGDPMGHIAYDRTISFIVHRDAIFKFITKYLAKQE